MSAAHRKAFNFLSYGIQQQSGFILLTGEVGTGKTTLVRSLIKSQLTDVVLSKIFNTKVHSRQLLEMILEDFGVRPTGKDKPALLRELNNFLIEKYANKLNCVLIIDEAQNLTRELLEEIRMLSNLESDNQKLLRIILVGQPELTQLLAAPELLQLRQRIQVSCHIHPLPEKEIAEYIAYRLEAAGNREAATFEPDVYAAIAQYTRGVPRLINILCDYLLLDAYANETRTITAQAVHEVARDLNFDAQYWNSTQAPEEPPQAPAPSPMTVQVPSRVSSKITSLLKNLNTRIKCLEEALENNGSSRQAQFSQEQNEIVTKLTGLQDLLQGRMEELWQAVGQLSGEVHLLKKHLESNAAHGVLPQAGPAQDPTSEPDCVASGEAALPENSGLCACDDPPRHDEPASEEAEHASSTLAHEPIPPLLPKTGWWRRFLSGQA